MSSFNKVILLGNVTRDPQLSYLPTNTAIVEVGLAMNRTFKKKDGSKGEEVCFVDCKMFGKRAEVINQYVKKGNQLFIEGRLKLDQWEAQDGSKRSKLSVMIENFEFIGGQKQNEQQPAQ
jgi:single-strand DNA-binding protein